MKIISSFKLLLIMLGLLFSHQATASPGTPTIAWMSTDYDAPAQYTVKWNMWWGNNGDVWYLLENATIIHTATLTANGQNAQTGQLTINQTASGNYDYQIKLCDSSTTPESCTLSAIKTITVNGGTVIVNQAPVANAGADQSASPNQAITLAGSYTDDSKTSPITESWAKVSGPGSVSFSNASLGNSTVIFSAVGSYVLSYTVDDTEFSSSDQLSINVSDAPPPPPADAPAKPTIGWIASNIDLVNGAADISINWNMWWGTNGNEWRLLQDGVVVHTSALTSNGNSAQSGNTQITVTEAKTYQFVVSLCNASGTQTTCTDSNPTSVTVAGGSSGGSSWPTDKGSYPQPLKQNNVSYNNTSNKMVAAYFVEWGIYGRDFHVADIPVENLTHIFYGFVPLCGANESLRSDNPQGHAALMSQCQGKQDYEVVVHDKFAALEKSYPGDVEGQDIKGIFGEFYRMKLANPEVKIIPSVGGWTLSDPLYQVGIDPVARKVFIDSMMDYLRTYPIFDGVDIDWEFPGGGGLNASLGTPQDGDGFADLMQELRAALDDLSVETGKSYELIAALSSGPKISTINWERAAQYMDYINVMMYDFYGAWNNLLGHQAGIHESQMYTGLPGFYGDAAITHLLSRNVPSTKITVGVAMYGRGWKGVTGVIGDNPFSGMGAGAITGTWQAGIEDYKVLESSFMTGTDIGANGYELRWDDIAKANYLWNASTGTLISLDTKRSTVAKGNYVQANNLGGVFAWEIDGDNGNILNAMHEGLGHTQK